MSILATLLGLALLLLLVFAFSAPLEALGWWSGWSERRFDLSRSLTASLPPLVEGIERDGADYDLVYLTGIIGYDEGAGGKREVALLELVEARLHGRVQLIHDVFPYSVSNNPLDGERVFRRLWQWLDQRRQYHQNPITPYNWLIILRNLMHVAVSADPRYGPLNNFGLAHEIGQSLLRHGYAPGSNKPIYLIAYSGGGQMSVGAARYLRPVFNAPVMVVGLGGVISDDPGLSTVDRVVNLIGTRDVFRVVSPLLFPGHLSLLPYSKWNRARRTGRLRTILVPDITHFGRRDYFSRSTKQADGRSHAEIVSEIVAAQMALFHQDVYNKSDISQTDRLKA